MSIEQVRSRLNRGIEQSIASKPTTQNQVLFYAGVEDGQHYGRLVPSTADTGGTQKIPLDWRLNSTPPLDTAIACTIVGSKRIAVGFA